MEKINVAVTGYVGTGSSAIIGLLREFENFEVSIADPYEHIVFYVPDGLFDLEYKLLHCNDPHRSDEAINSFINKMKWLSENNFGWFGSYENLYQQRFMNIVYDFVNEISKQGHGKWYNQYRKVKFSLAKVPLQLAAKVVYKRPVAVWGRQYVYRKQNETYNAFPTEKEFYEAAQKFVSRYLDLTSDEYKNGIYDHLIWPSQIDKIDRFFPENFKVIHVDRDPRDLYVINKIYWSQPPNFEAAPFPIDIDEYCEYMKRLRMFDGGKSEKALKIQFEDLIYKYDETVEKIAGFLNIDINKHIEKFRIFDPKKSIKNTQAFLINDETKKAGELIKVKLPELIYDFPYENKTETKEMFL